MEILLNGVDASTGNYLVPPFGSSHAAALARGDQPERGLLRRLRAMLERLASVRLGLPLGIDPRDPRQAGWGIVFHGDESPAVHEALAPLIEHRRHLCGSERMKVLEWRPGESWSAWLAQPRGRRGEVR